MAESFGGSRGRNDNLGTQKAFGLTRTQGGGNAGFNRPGSARGGAGGGAGGSVLNRPATARPSSVGRQGGVAAAIGGGRPSSAPRERPAGDKSLATVARVKELRHVKEAQYWGRPDRDTIRANTKDLPAFWSIREHGQPFNDERLASGITNLFRLKQQGALAAVQADATAVGPAAMQQAALRKSLETGKRHFTSIADLTPLPHDIAPTEALSDAEREFLINRLTPYQRIHALHQCLDKDPNKVVKEWMPWPLSILNRETLRLKHKSALKRPHKYNEEDWVDSVAQRDLLMRLAVSELEYIMRRHLKYMSDKKCDAARAPTAMEKDILRQAFWRVDPQKTGAVSIQQFLQVWQNLLRLQEYEDDWVKGKDLKGRITKKQILKPLYTMLLDRNMAAALFVKYGFDKEGLMPYVVFINALCETPARLLGHEVILKKKEVGKNGLEDDMDISLCMGNAKIEYRYCSNGVFPPGEFTSNMGRRSFKPPKAHMWLDHVYGYAGMLEYTRQSNIFYTHNTGKPLSPETANAVAVRRGEVEGSTAAGSRPEHLKRVEFVYYTGSVGIVFDKEKFEAGLPCQRYFFGHNNDIQCLTIHPNRKWVATGQQKNTGPSEVPYVCIWDVDHCMQLQRLDHDRNERGVIALCFSGDIVEGKGGDVLLTITSDDKHTIHVWRWLPHSNKYINAHYIPGWYLGPEKKIRPLRLAQGADGTGPGELYFDAPYEIRDEERVQDSWLSKIPFDLDNWNAACLAGKCRTGFGDESEAVQRILAASRQKLMLDQPTWHLDEQWWKQGDFPAPAPGSEPGPCPMWSHLEHPDLRVRADDADGMYMFMRAVKREDGFLMPGADEEKQKLPHLEQTLNGCNGTPPMVYGVVWNRLRPSTGRKGSEFAIYGVKHLRVFIANDEGRFIGTPASFGKDKIENILSALYVPAMHENRAPSDSCILTGFASGKLGLWVPPYPIRPGAVYTLVQRISAHGLGKQITLVDGTQVNGGVRALSLRRAGDGSGALEVLSGGADGCVKLWRLEEVLGPRPDGTPSQGVKLTKWGKDFMLAVPSPPPVPGRKKEEAPLVVALDAHVALNREFLAGTDGCDIWEVDEDPRILVEGHEEYLDELASHAECPYTFATACTSGKCRVWDTRRRDVVKSADLGYKLTGIAFSQEQLPFLDESKAVLWEGYHLALSGNRGELTVLRSDNMQPMVQRNDIPSKQGIPELKYSPFGGPRMLAAASDDQYIYLYKADRNYQLVSRCAGHSCTVNHVDWSLPVVLPGTPFDGKFLLQSCDTAGAMLYWDPWTGKKVTANLRDAEWHTWTLTVGFPVMGIWADDSDGSDVNAVDRARLGMAIYDPYEAEYEGSTEAALHHDEQDGGDGICGASFLVTADDYSTIKMFNYPVVADDAPYKAFRGHASHVACCRFMSDDRMMVSVGGNDRAIFQWRTCGVASGMPPLPVLYRMLGECMVKSGNNPDAARDLRGDLWDRLQARSRTFRSYERLKLYAMRVAIEEKRTGSAASAQPRPKLPEQMVWAKVPGSNNQYGPVPRKLVTTGLEEGTGSPGFGIGAMAGASFSGGKAGASGMGSPAMTPRRTPRGSAGGAGSIGGASMGGASMAGARQSPSGGGVGDGGGGGTPQSMTPRASVAASPRNSVRESAAASPRNSVRGLAAAASPTTSILDGPTSARTPSARTLGGGGGGGSRASGGSIDGGRSRGGGGGGGGDSMGGASEDLAGFSVEVGSYEPSGVPSPGPGGQGGGRGHGSGSSNKVGDRSGKRYGTSSVVDEGDGAADESQGSPGNDEDEF